MADEQHPVPVASLASSAKGRTSGKPWKYEKSPVVRSHLQPALKAKSWSDRIQKTKKEQAIKNLEAELKEEKQTELTRRREVTMARKKAAEERRQAEEMKAQVCTF
ncbi:hypothetical protein OF83DRAFT_1051788 [Amylostereum chailletii]|nr:hypothetical protein OF83DRAFT_1051788 [Amylostereum chailletii]